MSHQFKPGDLALTLSPLPGVPAGSVVELYKFIPKGFVFKSNQTTAAEDGWAVVVAQFNDDKMGYYGQRHLMPLRGDFAPEREKVRELMP